MAEGLGEAPQEFPGTGKVRDHRRHFVSSKVMAWVAVDRAIRLAEARRLPADLDWG